MPKPTSEPTHIHVKGARVHSLKNVDVRLPRGKLSVMSGSGKSSLAFDTLYAQGYRKFMESLSARSRALLAQVDKPDVDFIHGLSPVIAIEQHTSAGANPRSTVGSVTEIAEYARIVWCVAAEQRDPVDGAPIVQQTQEAAIERLLAYPQGARLMLLAPILKARAAVLRETLPRLRQKGFQRVRLRAEGVSLDAAADQGIVQLDDLEAVPLPRGRAEAHLDLVVDRLVLRADQRSRLADSMELAMQEGQGRVLALVQQARDEPWQTLQLSNALCGRDSGIVYEPLTPRHFSWNHPEGACEACGGLGETLQFSPDLLVPDPSLSVQAGALKPWRLGSRQMILRRNAALKQFASQLPFDPKVPWADLPEAVQQALLHGTGQRLFSFKFGRSKAVEQPFEGVLADLENTRKTTRSEGLKARLMAYQSAHPCVVCGGERLSSRARHAFVDGLTFCQFMAMPVSEALQWLRQWRSGLSDGA